MNVRLPMFGLPCDTCARQARWFIDGITLPCGCGALPGEQTDQIASARAIARQQRERLMNLAKARSQNPAQREEWAEIYCALMKEYV